MLSAFCSATSNFGLFPDHKAGSLTLCLVARTQVLLPLALTGYWDELDGYGQSLLSSYLHLGMSYPTLRLLTIHAFLLAPYSTGIILVFLKHLGFANFPMTASFHFLTY